MVVRPPALLPGEGLLFISPLIARGVVLPPADALDQLLADRARCGAARQQMLGAVDLRRLGQHRGAAVLDQQVDGRAERRIGGDAGIAVRAAALQRQHDLGGRTRLALRARGDRQHRLDPLDALARPSCACRRSPGWSWSGSARPRPARIPPSCGRSGRPRSRARPSARRRDWDASRSPIASAAAPRSPRPCRHAAAGAVHERNDAVDLADSRRGCRSG